MALPDTLHRFQLRTLNDVHRHLAQDDALIATWYSPRDPMILHRGHCDFFKGDEIELEDWPKCGTSIQTFEEFQQAVDQTFEALQNAGRPTGVYSPIHRPPPRQKGRMRNPSAGCSHYHRVMDLVSRQELNLERFIQIW